MNDEEIRRIGKENLTPAQILQIGAHALVDELQASVTLTDRVTELEQHMSHLMATCEHLHDRLDTLESEKISMNDIQAKLRRELLI